MNNTRSRQIVTVINIKEIIWDLLGQWKAVLIAALLMMMLVAGAKYANDMRGYRAAQAEKKAEAQSAVSAEERIAEILDALPEEERSTVMTVAKQQEWIESEKDYINNSILMNTDPTNQRTLIADYYIKAAEESDSVRNSLIYGYRSYLKDLYVVEALGKVIDPNAKSNYIAELIRTDSSAYTDEIEPYDTVLQVYVVLPEDTDAQKVEETLTTLIKEKTPEISSRVATHSIELIGVSEAYLYNSDAVTNQNDILYSIYNLQNNTRNMQSSLTDGQKAAIEAITAINLASNAADEAVRGDTDAISSGKSKPGISKKYAFLGFVLGIILYAFIYLIMVIVRGRINCSGDVEYYTQSRLLGEAYHQDVHKGFDALLHSAFVDKFRYRGKLDEDSQVKKASSKLETVCRHAGLDVISVLCTSDLSEVKKRLIDEIRAKGLDVNVTEVREQADDNYLLFIKDAVLLTDNETMASELLNLISQLSEYDVKLHGSMYYSCI